MKKCLIAVLAIIVLVTAFTVVSLAYDAPTPAADPADPDTVAAKTAAQQTVNLFEEIRIPMFVINVPSNPSAAADAVAFLNLFDELYDYCYDANVYTKAWYEGIDAALEAAFGLARTAAEVQNVAKSWFDTNVSPLIPKSSIYTAASWATLQALIDKYNTPYTMTGDHALNGVSLPAYNTTWTDQDTVDLKAAVAGLTVLPELVTAKTDAQKTINLYEEIRVPLFVINVPSNPSAAPDAIAFLALFDELKTKCYDSNYYEASWYASVGTDLEAAWGLARVAVCIQNPLKSWYDTNVTPLIPKAANYTTASWATLQAMIDIYSTPYTLTGDHTLNGVSLPAYNSTWTDEDTVNLQAAVAGLVYSDAYLAKQGFIERVNIFRDYRLNLIVANQADGAEGQAFVSAYNALRATADEAELRDISVYTDLSQTGDWLFPGNKVDLALESLFGAFRSRYLVDNALKSWVAENVTNTGIYVSADNNKADDYTADSWDAFVALLTAKDPKVMTDAESAALRAAFDALVPAGSTEPGETTEPVETTEPGETTEPVETTDPDTNPTTVAITMATVSAVLVAASAAAFVALKKKR